MLDVHPPQHSANTWREFIIHIATIVVGLLIAIGLEQSVEWMHGRHLVHHTEANLRQEMHDNRARLAKDEENLDRQEDRLEANLAILAAAQGHRPASGELNLSLGLGRAALGCVGGCAVQRRRRSDAL